MVANGAAHREPVFLGDPVQLFVKHFSLYVLMFFIPFNYSRVETCAATRTVSHWGKPVMLVQGRTAGAAKLGQAYIEISNQSNYWDKE
jgi:hypothetical protein